VSEYSYSVLTYNNKINKIKKKKKKKKMEDNLGMSRGGTSLQEKELQLVR
jgi:hypothetical protein